MGTENGGGCANLLRRVVCVWQGKVTEKLELENSTQKKQNLEEPRGERETTGTAAEQSKIESPHTSTPQHHHGPTTAPETP